MINVYLFHTGVCFTDICENKIIHASHSSFDLLYNVLISIKLINTQTPSDKNDIFNKINVYIKNIIVKSSYIVSLPYNTCY